MGKTNSSDDEIKGWLNILPTKTSRLAVKFALTSVVGVPSLLAVLTNLSSYPVFSNNTLELLLLSLLLLLVICLLSISIALVSVVKHCHTKNEKIKSLEKDLKFEQGISMMHEITKIQRSL